MRIPVISGVIERRILVNFRVDAEAMAQLLPPPFRPQLVSGYGIGGICLIRLKEVKPKVIPCPQVGISSENAAHRFAVEWEHEGQLRQGVYIPRRDTNSTLNHLAGGRLFPGVHHLADFEVQESSGAYSVRLTSRDQETRLYIAGKVADSLPQDSVFRSLQEASDFVEGGSLGYSPANQGGCYDGLELRTTAWKVQPLEVEEVHSSYFEALPSGSWEFDHALLMHDIEHEWHDRGLLRKS